MKLHLKTSSAKRWPFSPGLHAAATQQWWEQYYCNKPHYAWGLHAALVGYMPNSTHKMALDRAATASGIWQIKVLTKSYLRGKNKLKQNKGNGSNMQKYTNKREIIRKNRSISFRIYDCFFTRLTVNFEFEGTNNFQDQTGYKILPYHDLGTIVCHGFHLLIYMNIALHKLQHVARLYRV